MSGVWLVLRSNWESPSYSKDRRKVKSSADFEGKTTRVLGQKLSLLLPYVKHVNVVPLHWYTHLLLLKQLFSLPLSYQQFLLA